MESRKLPEWAYSYGSAMRQLAIWASERGEPIGPRLRKELRRLNLLGEFETDTPHTFITVVLPVDMDINVAAEQVASMKHKWFDEARAVLEGWPAGNPHVHIVSKGRPLKTNVIRCLSKRFGVEAPKVDVRQSNSHELYLKRRGEYILGNKVKDKLAAVQADREFRDAEGVPHIFSFT